MRKILLLSAATHMLAAMPLPPVAVEYLDGPKPAPDANKRAKVKALVRVPHRDETDHQTEKPVPLMVGWMHQCSPAGGLVIDPFMGAGSTAVAAAQLGRRFIGIEIQRKWFDVACQRVEAAYSGRQGVLL